jgi:phosphoglycolate phosphatase-like HAD superfamily hydrolase
MNLIIFDIDGTLTQTNEVDSRCFTYAIDDILQLKNINTDWASYKYSTDSGLLKEIYAAFKQREPHQEEIDLIRERFVTHLQNEWHSDKTLYTPVPGAEYIFDLIRQLSNWHLAIATGGWKKSALFKLDSATIPHAPLPKAFADDHFERAEIIKIAINHSKAINNIDQYQRIIYVGDREWDERAASALNIEFVGVGSAFAHRSASDGMFLQDYHSSIFLLDYLAQQSPKKSRKLSLVESTT